MLHNRRIVQLLALSLAALSVTLSFPNQTQGQENEPDYSKLDAALFRVAASHQAATLGLTVEQQASRDHVAQFSSYAFTSAEGIEYVEGLIKTDGSLDGLTDLGVTVQSVVGEVVAASMPVEALGPLTLLPNVEFVEASRQLRTFNDTSAPSTGAPNFHNAGITGAGAIVVVIDSDIDFRHQDFRNPDGTTRIKFLCDQTDAPQGGDASCPGLGSPTGGTLWTEAQINADLAGTPTVRQTATGTHGTHVTGSAAGNDSTYGGMAPGADIIFVKSTLNSVDVINSLSFIDDKAADLGLPYVINMSFGGHFGPHDGTDAQSVAINGLVGAGTQGKVIVAAAGNEGASNIHASADLAGGNQTVQVEVPTRAVQFFIEVWYDGTENFTFGFTDAQGGGQNNIGSGFPFITCVAAYCYTVTHTFNQPEHNNSKNVELVVTPPNGGNEITVPGTWSFTLSGTPTSNGVFHAWCERSCTFPNGDTNFTIGEPASAANAITVGAINNKPCWDGLNGNRCYGGPPTTGDIAGFSSIGPTRDGRTKPDIIAPGEGIASSLSSQGSVSNDITLPGGRHFINQGTSMASPHVAGAVALYLAENPALDAATILQTLKDNATVDAQTGAVPNNSAGFGKLNIAPLDAIPPTLGIADVTVGEGVGEVDLTITLSPASDQIVTVGYGTSDDTATSGEDYVPTGGTATFQVGETSKTISVTIIDDAMVEDDVSFDVTLSNPTGNAQLSAVNDVSTVTIQDNDLTVTKTDDTNNVCSASDCSLREAIAAVTAGGTIIIPSGTYTLNAALQELLITKDLTLAGASSNDTIIQAHAQRRTANFGVVGINIQGQEGAATISGVTIRHGNTNSGGGIAVLSESHLRIIDSIVSDNDANFGAGIFTNPNVQLTITNSTISGNLAGTGSGGGIYLNTGGTLSVTGSTITGNTSAQGGGVLAAGTSATITNTTFTNNSATGAGTGGGAVFNGQGSQLTITGSDLNGNTAPAGFGGAVFGSGVTEIRDSTMNGNTSGSSGGTIFNTDEAITISNTTISGSSSGAAGGIDNRATLTITDSTLSGNSAPSGSGGIWNFGTATIANSTISSNSSGSGSGGAITNDPGAELTITDSTLSGNTADAAGQVGGGIYNLGTATLTRSTLSDNSSGSSGGGGVYNNGGTLNVTNSTFSGNSTTGQGGAITNFDGVVTILNSTIASNKATQAFGGILSFGSGTVTLKNTLLSNTGGNCNDATSLGHNLDTDFTCSLDQTGDKSGIANPNIALFQDNGGPTQTHELLSGSSAIDAGDDTAAPATDQRGFARQGVSDIGSFEALGALPSHTLTVTKDGSGTGTVTSDPVGIDCGGDCTEEIVEGTQVTLTAAPDTGSLFSAWTGCDTVSGDQCTVMVNAPMTVNATFNEKEPEPFFLDQWGAQGDGNGQFESPTGIALDSDGNVYVVDRGNDRIQKFDSSGNFLDTWGSGGTGSGEFVTPSDVAIDGSGNVFVSDEGLHRIQKFDSSGNVLGQWGSFGSGTPEDGEFNEPTGIAVDGSGNVYVADSKNHRIQKFDTDGNFITKWGSSGQREGQFAEPSGIAVDSNGFVYISDWRNKDVQKFDGDGNFIKKWGTRVPDPEEFSTPRGITVGPQDSVYVVDSATHRILKFNADGNLLAEWGTQGVGSREFLFPQDIAVNADGAIYVADRDNYRIQKFGTSPLVNLPTDLSVDEDAGTLTVEVTLSDIHSEDVTIDFTVSDGTAIAPDDYSFVGTQGQDSSGSLTIEAGGSSAGIIINIVDDALDEDDKTFTVTLSNVVNAQLPQASEISTVTIQDDDPTPVVTVVDVTVDEGGGTVQVVVSLSSMSSRDVTVGYSTADDSAVAPDDFTHVADTATIPAESLSTTVSIPIIDDDIFEPNETFTVTLSNPVNAELNAGASSATVTINNDDVPPTVSIEETASVVEGADGTQTQASLDVTLSNILGVDVTVNYSTSDDTATAGQDYVAATDSVTVTAGEISAPLQVTVNGDDTDEGDETFSVTLSSAIFNFGALGIDQSTGTVTILDDDGTIVAESTLRPALDDDGIAVAELRVERVKYEGVELTATLPGGVQSFDATLTYDTNLVEILDVREVAEFAGNTTFDSATTPGQLTISGSIASTPVDPTELVLAKIVVRLIGSATAATQFTLTDLQITEDGTATVYNQDSQASNTYQRGDVLADRQVDVNDRVLLAQCIVELTTIGDGQNDCHAINGASTRHDGAAGDKVRGSDGLFITQFIVGLRDNLYRLLPVPGGESFQLIVP